MSASADAPTGSAADPSEVVDRLARDVLGIDALRPAQRQAIEAAVGGHDVLAVLPTGSGKSAIYQVAGLARGGTTVVVSPMIALQHDQVRSLSGRTLPDGRPLAVVAVNSTSGTRDRREALLRWREDGVDVVLLGPEQLENGETRATLRESSRPVTLIAVDEAHLVSEWGHDFRPDYRHLGGVVEELGHPPVIALTATAAPPVRADIVRELRLVEPEVVIAGFDRPNIALAVRTTHARGTTAEVNGTVEDAAVEAVIELETPALVYAPSHAACERIAARLRSLQWTAEPYHAGLKAAERTTTQDAFLADQLDVVVATSAFGMGIDKPDVRSVVHAGPPGSLDEYYQEIGRAGRDGGHARAVLVFDQRALSLPTLFASRSRLDDEKVRRVVNGLLRADGRITLADLAATVDVPANTTQRVVDELVSSGLADLSGDGATVAPGARRTLSAEGADEVEEAARRRETVMRSRIDEVRRYAETQACRRVELLGYFGEQFDGPCGNCDNDVDPTAAHDLRAELPPGETTLADNPDDIAPGDLVTHIRFGRGTVMSVDAHEVVVAFDDAGYKELSVAVLSNGLLTRTD